MVVGKVRGQNPTVKRMWTRRNDVHLKHTFSRNNVLSVRCYFDYIQPMIKQQLLEQWTKCARNSSMSAHL